MKKIKLTKTTVEKLPFADKGKQVDYYDSDLDGFGVRVSHTGKKYFVRRLIGIKRVRVMIGSHPIKTAEEARGEARIKLGVMESGIDPNKHKRDQLRLAEESKQEITVTNLISEYIERHAKRFKRSWEADERLLTKEILPIWGKRKANDINKRDVTLLLERIIDRGTPAMSNQVLKITRKMFNFAIERDILKHTPFTGVKALAPNNRRERTLSESEIRIVWESIENSAMSDEIRRSLKLILVTAQRPKEVTGMHTREIEDRWWTIPAERAKNGREHRVYLTDMALVLIGETTDKDYIFPCPHQNKIKPISSHSLPVAVRRNIASPLTDKQGKPLYGKEGKPATENVLNIGKFTPHDLRRTAATFMGALGFMDEVIDAVLNHAKQGVIRTYNRHDYDKEKQQALDAWALKLTAITTCCGKGAEIILPDTHEGRVITSMGNTPLDKNGMKTSVG